MQLRVNIPDRYLLNFTPEELAEQFKLSTALLMFQSGQLSAGAACEFAGIDRYTFLASCKRHGINVIDYAEEALEADFELLKQNYPFSHADRR